MHFICQVTMIWSSAVVEEVISMSLLVLFQALYRYGKLLASFFPKLHISFFFFFFPVKANYKTNQEKKKDYLSKADNVRSYKGSCSQSSGTECVVFTAHTSLVYVVGRQCGFEPVTLF